MAGPRPTPHARRHGGVRRPGGLPRPGQASTLESSTDLRTVLRRSGRAVSSVVGGSQARAALYLRPTASADERLARGAPATLADDGALKIG